MHFAILAQSPREMALTDRILPRYFLSRVRVSIRPRFFYTPKNPRPNQPAARSHASVPPTVRTAQFETQIIPSRQVATYVRGGRLWMILLAPMQNHPSLRKSYPRCNDPAKRGSVCEAFEKKPLPLALKLLLRYRYWATRPTGQKLWAIIGRLTGLTASELVILASCRGMGAFQAMPGVIVTESSTMKCCDGNCVRRWPLTSFGSYRPGPYPHKGKGVCVRDVCAIYDSNISPSLLMIIIKIIILYFIQIRHTDAFPPTGTLLVIIIIITLFIHQIPK